MNARAAIDASARMMKFSDLRRLVADMVAQGCTVDIRPDGSIKVSPAIGTPAADPFDLVDVSK